MIAMKCGIAHVIDDLYAKAAVLDDDGTRVALDLSIKAASPSPGK